MEEGRWDGMEGRETKEGWRDRWKDRMMGGGRRMREGGKDGSGKDEIQLKFKLHIGWVLS